MNQKINLMALSFGVAFFAQGSAIADSCNSVEREMTYGSVALEDAKDKNGFMQSAREFEAAVKKAPDCAAAYFNLGLVYEKAGEYEKALKALQAYLRLSPNASDAAQVRKKTYQLEYRVKQASNSSSANMGWEKYAGAWCDTSSCDHPKWGKAKFNYHIKISGDQFEATKRYRGGQQKGLHDYTHSFVGTINQDGSLTGTVTDATLFFNQPNCSNIPLKDSYPFTGEISDKSMLDSRGNSITGGVIIFRYRLWTAINRDYNNCRNVRTTEYGGGWQNTTIILKRR